MRWALLVVSDGTYRSVVRPLRRAFGPCPVYPMKRSSSNSLHPPRYSEPDLSRPRAVLDRAFCTPKGALGSAILPRKVVRIELVAPAMVRHARTIPPRTVGLGQVRFAREGNSNSLRPARKGVSSRFRRSPRRVCRSRPVPPDGPCSSHSLHPRRRRSRNRNARVGQLGRGSACPEGQVGAESVSSEEPIDPMPRRISTLTCDVADGSESVPKDPR